MKVAIFGANGYVGRHLVHFISLNTTWNVTGYDLQEKFIGTEEISYFSIDILDKFQLSKCAFNDETFFTAV